MKKILIIILSLIWLPSLSISANGVPYITFTYSSSNQSFVFTQDAYIPLSRIDNFNGITLKSPSDIVFDKEDQMYIADRELGFVIKYNVTDNTSEIIGEGILNAPTGVHVDDLGRVYVTDFGLKQAFQFVKENDTYVLKTTYEKPLNSPFFDDQTPFDPSKVVTDKAYNVYVLLSGNVNGLAQFKNDGTFFGYFGGNKIEASWQNTLTYLFFDEQTRRDLFQIIPDPLFNVAVDQDGLILTTTKGIEGYVKLNIANNVYNSSVFGYDDIEDITVGPFETIFTVSASGRIVEYGPDGSVLFIFSGTDTSSTQGLFKNPKGIAVDSKSNIYVVDATTKALQIFMPTSFADLIHVAISLYQDGRYQESLIPWQNVLEQNALFDLANQGLGDAYFAQMNYEQALYFYEIARDRIGYSDAFWEVRNDLLQNSGTFIVILIASLVVLSALYKPLKIGVYVKKPFTWLDEKTKHIKLIQDLRYSFYVLKKPSDGYSSIKREKKGSYVYASIYYVLFFMMYIIYIYQTSFLFNNVIAARIDIVEEAVSIFVPILLFVSANYLVSSIRDGEGRFRDVYIGLSTVLLPAIIMLPFATLVSQGISLNEAFIFDFIMGILYALTAFYMIFMIKEIHYYEVKQTVSNILISVFTALMIVVVVFIVYLLLGEVVTLVLDIIREVTVRG